MLASKLFEHAAGAVRLIVLLAKLGWSRLCVLSKTIACTGAVLLTNLLVAWAAAGPNHRAASTLVYLQQLQYFSYMLVMTVLQGPDRSARVTTMSRPEV